MSSLLAPISKILTWSCVDGPGNRMVLFFQGCNLNCLACHNPHTIGQCNHCGDCLDACPQAALSWVEDKVHFNAARCDQCDACLNACPINANPMVKHYSVDELLAKIRDAAPFLTGVTVSGGEATVHLPFIRALFTAIKDDPTLCHLTRFIDSNGHLPASAWASILPVTDGVMLDIKALDQQLHRALTTRPNDRILTSARLLHEEGKLYELRFLMVPGHTDRSSEIEALITFVKSLGGDVRVRLNGFRTHGVRGEAASWPAMPRDGLEAAADRLKQAGLSHVCLPAI